MANISVPTGAPHYGDDLIVGYLPTSPILIGHKFRLVCKTDSTTQTDVGTVSGLDIFDETRSIATGTAAQRTKFHLAGGSEWSGGGAQASLTLLDPSGAPLSNVSFDVEP